MAIPGIIATDLDGTLFSSSVEISFKNHDGILQARQKGFLLIIATGRSVYSFNRSFPKNIEIDYLVFSSGSGVLNMKTGAIEQINNLNKRETELAFKCLMKYNLDFAVLNPVPENHRFVFVKRTSNRNDFDERNKYYDGFFKVINPVDFVPGDSCQLLAMPCQPDGIQIYEQIKKELDFLKVIRTTSPIDGKTIWIEIYSKNVSKAAGLNFLARKYNVSKKNILVIGNDFNDLDMLEWADNPRVVANAPAELKSKFPVVSSNDENGVAQAINSWIAEKERI